MMIVKPQILFTSLVLSTLCVALQADSERQEFDKKIHMRTIEVPKELLVRNQQLLSLNTFLEEMRAVEEMAYGNEWSIENIPETYRSRYENFRKLVRKASNREETLNVYSEVRKMWLTCASLTAGHGSKRLYCGRSKALGSWFLPSNVRSVAVAGRNNKTGETSVYALSLRQFDYDEEEQSCEEEIEEKEFNFPSSSSRMTIGGEQVMVEVDSGIALTVGVRGQ